MDAVETEAAKKQTSLIEAVYKSGVATINDHDYVFTKCTHSKRLRVFGFYSSVMKQVESGNMAFLGTKEWLEIESIIFKLVTYNDDQLHKLSNHFDTFPEDYLKFIMVALPVICWPFLRGNVSS